MSTLQIILGQIPMILKQRYQDQGFWIPKANQVLGDIEVISDGKQAKTFTPLYLEKNVIEYLLPPEIREYMYLREPVAGEPSLSSWPVRSSGGYQELITLQYPFPFYENDDITGTITGVSGKTFTALELAGLDNLASRLVTLQKSDGSKYARIISFSESDETEGTVTPAGPWGSYGVWDILPEVGDTFTITRNFLIVEGLRKYRRFDTSELVENGIPSYPGLSEENPLGDKWDKLIEYGLKYYGEIQTDKDSNNARIWKSEYETAKKEFKLSTRNPRGESAKAKPASWPSLQTSSVMSTSFQTWYWWGGGVR